jgi:hypothetical protein
MLFDSCFIELCLNPGLTYVPKGYPLIAFFN